MSKKINKEIKENEIILEDEHGNEKLCRILFTYEAENQKNYVVFEFLDSHEISAATVIPDENDKSTGQLVEVNTDEEWDMLSDLLDRYYEDNEDADTSL